MPLTFQQQVVAATSTSTDEVAEVDVDDSDLETTGAVLVDFDWTPGGQGWRSQIPTNVVQSAVPGGDGGQELGQDLDRIGVMKKEHYWFMFERVGRWRV